MWCNTLDNRETLPRTINTFNATSFKSVCYSYDYVMNLNYSYFS